MNTITPLKLVIIDDEQDARTTLRALLKQYCPDIQIVGEADNVMDGIGTIRSLLPDIVLLDIQLGNATGFDLLDKFSNPNFQVIFTTAYDQFALKAFKYAAIDYILKPIDPKDLIIAIDRAIKNLIPKSVYQQQIQQLLHDNNNQSFDKIALSTATGLHFLKIKDIVFLKAAANYTIFITANNEKIMVSKTLKEFEELLPDTLFFRIHQSYILNIQFIKKFLKEDGGYALLDNGKKLPIARRKKEAFLNLLAS